MFSDLIKAILGTHVQNKTNKDVWLWLKPLAPLSMVQGSESHSVVILISFVKNIRGYQQGKVDSDYDTHLISITKISGVNVVFRMAVRFYVGLKLTVAPQPT